MDTWALVLDHGEWEEGLEIMLNPLTSHGRLRLHVGAVQEQCEEHKNRSEMYIWKVPRSPFSQASVGCAHPAAEA